MSITKRCIVLSVIIGCGITVQRESESSNGDPSIAIVGAGMAGLSAARRLSELGIHNFDVFEGASRIGGRIHPIEHHGGYLQMGAQFINGADNPIFRLASKLGVVAPPVGDSAHIDNPTYLLGDQQVDRADIELFLNFTAPLDPKYRDIAAHNEPVARVNTFSELYARDYEQFLSNNGISHGPRRKLFDALTRAYRLYWEFEWAADWTDLSVHVLKEWDDHGPIGESFMTDKFGYKRIIDAIHAFSPASAFHFNSTVRNIRYTPDGVYITTDAGEVPRRYDYVIVTTSLGVLKRFHRTMFTPPLPRKKTKIIDAIGFGGSCKLFFRWNKPFWSNDTVNIVPLPIEGQLRERIDDFENSLNYLQVVDWEPNTLVAWIAGAGHRVVDNLDDEALSEKLTRLLRDTTGNKDLSPPDEIVRTRLTRNPLLLGSYSYTTKRQALANITHAQLGQPVRIAGRPRVLFAGEATHYRLFQTAIGAYLSGRREADRAVADYEKAIVNGANGTDRRHATHVYPQSQCHFVEQPSVRAANSS